MSVDRDKILKLAFDAINENRLFFVEDVVGFVPCSKSTFYKYFPFDSDEMNDIKERLDVNKIQVKSNIRAKLFQSERASELLALYRLICTSEERQALNQNYVEITGKDGKDLPLKIEVVGKRAGELQDDIKEIE